MMKTQSFLILLIASMKLSAQNSEIKTAPITHKSDTLSYWCFQCYDQNEELSFLKWSQNGQKLDCIDESGRFDIYGEGFTMPFNFQEFYSQTNEIITSKYSTKDYLIKSVKIIDTGSKLTYVVNYQIADSNTEDNVVIEMTKTEPNIK